MSIESKIEELQAQIDALREEVKASDAADWSPDWDNAPDGAVACMVNANREITWLVTHYSQWRLDHTLTHVPLSKEIDWNKMFFTRPEPEINWSAVEYDWVAVDENGDAYEYDFRPTAGSGHWMSNGSHKFIHPCHLSREYLSLPWHETLRRRPE